MTGTRFFVISALAGMLSLASLAANAGVIEDRKANFKANNQSMRAMGAALAGGDFITIKTEADKIAAWAAVMPDYFPEGSGGSMTSAKPSIWEDFDAFRAAAKANHDAAMALSAAAEAGDADAAGATLRNLGGTCKSCHQSFKSW